MKKHLIAVLLVVIMCLAVLSGCSLMTGLEHDVQIILINDGNYVGTYTVNQFNNAIVPEVEKPVGEGNDPQYYQDGSPMYDEDGRAISYTFMGWSVLENWTLEDGDEYLTESPILIRYDDIKDFVEGEKLSITLYAAYAEVEPSDLVIAWYNRETTSGLNQTYMDAFEANLYSYLESQGYDTASMDIVIRSYSGDVGSSCSQIIRDGDVDIMVGWNTTSNITGTGGMTEGVDFLVNYGGVCINPDVSRYAALITNTELSRLVYLWIFEEYADGATVELPEIGAETVQPDEPEVDEPEDTEPVDPPEIDDNVIVIGWWSYSTSGLTAGIVENVVGSLITYLTAQGYMVEQVETAPAEIVEGTLYIIVREYSDSTVANMGSAINADGDIDIYLGAGANLQSTGGVEYIKRQSGIAMGASDNSRYVYQLTDSEICAYMFSWLISEDAIPLYLGTAATVAALAA